MSPTRTDAMGQNKKETRQSTATWPRCIGPQPFKYGFVSYSGTVDSAALWQGAERFNPTVRAAQIGPSSDGKLPLEQDVLPADAEGSVMLEITTKKIITLEFLP